MNNRARDNCKHPNNWGPANKMDEETEGAIYSTVIFGTRKGHVRDEKL